MSQEAKLRACLRLLQSRRTFLSAPLRRAPQVCHNARSRWLATEPQAEAEWRYQANATATVLAQHVERLHSQPQPTQKTGVQLDKLIRACAALTPEQSYPLLRQLFRSQLASHAGDDVPTERSSSCSHSTKAAGDMLVTVARRIMEESGRDSLGTAVQRLCPYVALCSDQNIDTLLESLAKEDGDCLTHSDKPYDAEATFAAQKPVALPRLKGAVGLAILATMIQRCSIHQDHSASGKASDNDKVRSTDIYGLDATTSATTSSVLYVSSPLDGMALMSRALKISSNPHNLNDVKALHSVLQRSKWPGTTMPHFQTASLCSAVSTVPARSFSETVGGDTSKPTIDLEAVLDQGLADDSSAEDLICRVCELLQRSLVQALSDGVLDVLPALYAINASPLSQTSLRRVFSLCVSARSHLGNSTWTDATEHERVVRIAVDSLLAAGAGVDLDAQSAFQQLVLTETGASRAVAASLLLDALCMLGNLAHITKAIDLCHQHDCVAVACPTPSSIEALCAEAPFHLVQRLLVDTCATTVMASSLAYYAESAAADPQNFAQALCGISKLAANDEQQHRAKLSFLQALAELPPSMPRSTMHKMNKELQAIIESRDIPSEESCAALEHWLHLLACAASRRHLTNAKVAAEAVSLVLNNADLLKSRQAEQNVAKMCANLLTNQQQLLHLSQRSNTVEEIGHTLTQIPVTTDEHAVGLWLHLLANNKGASAKDVQTFVSTLNKENAENIAGRVLAVVAVRDDAVLLRKALQQVTQAGIDAAAAHTQAIRWLTDTQHATMSSLKLLGRTLRSGGVKPVKEADQLMIEAAVTTATSPRDLLRLFQQQRGVRRTPPAESWRQLLRRCAESKDFATATDTIRELGKIGHPLEAWHYTTALRALISPKQIPQADKLLQDMRKAGIQPDVGTYTVYARKLLSFKQYTPARQTLKMIAKDGLELTDAAITLWLRFFVEANNEEVAFHDVRLFHEKASQRLNSAARRGKVYDSVLLAACKKHVEDVFQRLRSSQSAQLPETKREGFVPSPSIILSHDGDACKIASTIVDEARSANTLTQEMLILAAETSALVGQFNRVRELMDECRARGWVVGHRLVLALIHSAGNAADPVALSQVFEEVKAHYSHLIDIRIICALTFHFGRQRMMDEATSVYDVMLEKGLKPNNELNHILIRVCGIDPISVMWNAEVDE